MECAYKYQKCTNGYGARTYTLDKLCAIKNTNTQT